MRIFSDYYADDNRVEIVGDKGILFINRGTARTIDLPALMLFRDGRTLPIPLDRDEWQHSFVGSTRHLLDVLQYGGQPVLDGDAGRAVPQFALAAHQSTLTGREIYPDDVTKGKRSGVCPVWYNFSMFSLYQVVIERFVEELQLAYQQSYSIMEPEYGNILVWTGRLVLENIANSDLLYHTVDHTILVTLVGQAILKGKHLSEGGVMPKDWLHFVMALLCHDIGYVKGVCRDDGDGKFAAGVDGKLVTLPPGGTDAALTAYHIDRSMQFVRERFGSQVLRHVDAERIAGYIDMTRFPVPDDPRYADTSSYAGLVRAADFIGQLGDPNYLRKMPALFYEFEETGQNAVLGYKNPGDMRRNFTKFYWGVVRPRIQEALDYLRITQEGKQWIANLHSHVFDVEHGSFDL